MHLLQTSLSLLHLMMIEKLSLIKKKKKNQTHEEMPKIHRKQMSSWIILLYAASIEKQSNKFC